MRIAQFFGKARRPREAPAAPDAVTVDTTHLATDEVIAKLESIVRGHRK